QKGLIEHEFIKKINKEFTVPQTCIVGYNSIAFDDEFTRHTLFRNFLDPYAWHWQNSNTRWDILSVARFCYAHKEENSLNWFINDKNRPIFRLDHLAPANNIEHSDAHDAMADVRATIGIAKIIKETQPIFFNYALSLNEKKEVSRQVKILHPMLLTSSSFGYKCSFTKMVTAISYHPDYADRAIVFNLDQDPEILLELEVDELKTLVFSKKVDLPKGIDKLELSELVFNKSPMFVCSPNHDSFKLSPILVEKLKLDIDKYIKNLSFIQKNQKQIEDKVQSIYKQNLQREPSRDIDQSLYDGFISNKDKAICNEIQKLTINEIGQLNPNFEDRKLLKLFLNFKARNYPELLSDDEQEEWFEIVQSRVQNGENGFLSFDSFENSLDNLKNSNPEKDKLWQDLEAYAQTFL
ncbi:MAG: exodeoxyribonuclease I, partial [Candidatus Marinimicrobia bacterium]|nr:exodeoxyribonuclease I [Candidatus Neomarinimicrobiota bacterium]